jgi:aspartate-semialdehyde dehydrogenase
MPSGPGRPTRIAIVGASTLRGKELKQTLEDRNFPAGDIVLLDDTVMAGTLTEAAGEATFIRALEEDSFEDAQFAFFAGTSGETERNWETAKRAGANVIDLTGALAASGQATAWIPGLNGVLGRRAAGSASAEGAGRVYSAPATPVIVACTLAAALAAAKLTPRSFMLVMFPPISERDQAGIEELESQTAGLLSFREIAKPLFDAQVAFNLLAEYGPGSKESLGEARRAICRDAAAYLGDRAPAPAIQLVQAPVFYGYAFAGYAEFERKSAAAGMASQLEAALVNLGVKLSGAGETGPTNVSIAGESEIRVGRIEADPNVEAGAWIWGAADNLRLGAVNAVRIAEELLAK